MCVSMKAGESREVGKGKECYCMKSSFVRRKSLLACWVIVEGVSEKVRLRLRSRPCSFCPPQMRKEITSL